MTQQSLASFRSLRGRFTRSANVERDTGPNAVQNYLPTGRSLDAVRRFGRALALPGAGRALSITGPYGSGKSSLAVFLDALVSPENSEARKAADEILALTDPATLQLIRDGRQRLGATREGFIRAVITAHREPLSLTVLRALHHGASTFEPGSRTRSLRRLVADMHSAIARADDSVGALPTAQFVHSMVQALTEIAPVLLIVDEFGKNLESFADDPAHADLFVLQQLAEYAQGDSALPLVAITMQHLAFNEYVDRISDSLRREWAKVQGRFEDIPYGDTPTQTRMLISSAWEPTRNRKFLDALSQWADEQFTLCREVGLGPFFSGPEQIAGCWPLHPVAQLILPELCSRYGQNERTLFSFLASAEPRSAASFLKEVTWDTNAPLPSITADRLYDYFVESAGTFIGVSQTASRWMEIDVVIRDSVDLSDDQRSILKTIGITNLVSAGGSLRCSPQVVRYALGQPPSGPKKDLVGAALASLETRGLITFRDFADEYRLWQGSDLDLRSTIEAARRRVQTTSPARLMSRVRTLPPFVAGRHSQQTFTLRSFNRTWCDGTMLSLVPPSPLDAADGLVAYLLDQDGRIPSLQSSDANPKPVVVVTTPDSNALLDAAIEIAALQEILASDERVAGDWVARRELNERAGEAARRFENEFEIAFGARSGARWVWLRPDAAPQELPATAGASAVLSTVADGAYPLAPRVRNEMLNRTDLTSQGAKARRELLEGMVARSAIAQLGIEGFGPDRAMYEAVLREPGIHQFVDGQWTIAPPRDGSDFEPVWLALHEEFEKATDHRVGVDRILRRLSSPPYGVRAGTGPVLLTAALIVRSDDIAIYEHGTYRAALTADLSERMVRNPAHFELKHFATGAGVRGHVVEHLAQLLGVAPSLRHQRNSSLLGILNHLVSTIVIPLPEFSRRTKRLSKEALEVRQALLSATEPDVLLFRLLPQAVHHAAVPPSAPKRAWNSHLEWIPPALEAIHEIEHLYANLLEEIEIAIVEATGAPADDIRTAINGRIANLKTDVLDPRLRAFLLALRSPLEDDEWLVYVAATVAGSPPSAWSDDDAARFHASISDLGARFRRIEAVHYDRQSNDGIPFDAVRVTFTRDQGQEDDRMVWISERHREALEAQLERWLNEASKVTGSEVTARDSLLALLALQATERSNAATTADSQSQRSRQEA